MLSEADHTRIEEAVRQAEALTSGEIVVVVARSADPYRTVPLAAALLVSLMAPWPLLWFTDLGTTRILLIQLILALTALAVLLPHGARYALVPHVLRRQRAREAARQAFAANGLSQTRGRTGVLLYVAQAERYAEVIADSAVNAQVEDTVWRAAIEGLVAAARRGALGEGIAGAVAQIGAILSEHLPAGPDNPDELPNRVILQPPGA
jgi:putative membrane protein